MTHRQKWLEVAEAFGTPFDERTAEQKEITDCGLCYAFLEHSGGEIDGEMESFSGIIGKGWFPIRYRYLSTCWCSIEYPNMPQEQADDLRCLYACLFAAMTPREFREVTS